MKIYTRTGDDGSTGLFGGPRVAKDDGRIEAYGTVDELNTAIGVVRSAGVGAEIDAQLEQIQSELFSIGAELATPNPEQHEMRIIGDKHIQQLEQWIDQQQQGLPELKQFILPVGNLATTTTHLARSICRRAERRVITLACELAESDSPISNDLIVYLNRLSDLMFVLARKINHAAGDGETVWERPTT
jgi:cob(I)alamin adenosyltransferase